MKLNKFIVEQLNTSELQNVIGGQEMEFEGGGPTHSSRRQTVCCCSDQDALRHDSD
jgi:bacteriocin-like protein